MVTTVSRTFATGARLSLAGRAALVALVLFCEKFALNFLVDFDAAQRSAGLGAIVREAQHTGFRFAVAFGLSLALFAYARGAQGWGQINAAARGEPLRPGWLLAHGLLVLPLAPLSFYLYGRPDAPLPLAANVLLWLLFALGAVIALVAGMAPWRLWRRAAVQLGALWLYAAIAAAVAASALQWSQRLWHPTAAITFDLVYHLLAPFIPSLGANVTTLVLSSNRFAVEVSEQCSGLEGAGLLLTFCGAWLLCFRREYRFPRALLLIPVALLLSFALNVLRIATLMMIGYEGHPDIAIYGFHSQAGWIAFNCAAGLIAFASRRSRWLNRVAALERHAPAVTRPAAAACTPTAATTPAVAATAAAPASTRVGENATAAYLLPFLLILAAGMLARSISNGFETFYVFRPVAAGLALWWGWPRLRALDWRFSWRGPLIGALIFLLWVGVAHLLTRAQPMPAALAGFSPAGRVAWIAVRIAAAVITVPIAEELAFRGYLMRRLLAADFESVAFVSAGVTALVVSSLVFGLEHGTLWLPGVLAGLAYGAVLIHTGRMGEAVSAHATSNALLAAYVLLGVQWQLW